MAKEMKKGQLKEMEDKNSDKLWVGSTVKLQEEKPIMSINDQEEDVINKGKQESCQVEQEENNLKPSSPGTEKDLALIQKETITNGTTDNPPITETNTDSSPSVLKNDHHQEDSELIKSTKAEMDEVREENERLKLLLSRILKDYQSLQTHFFDILRQQEANNDNNNNNNKDNVKPLNKDSSTSTAHDDHDNNHDVHQENDNDELVSLSLGRTSSTSTTHHEEPRRNERKITTSSKDNDDHDEKEFNTNNGEVLALGLGTGSSSKITEDQKEEATEMWPPSKVLKTARSNGGDEDNDGASQMSPLKKARVSVRARCDTPTMNDGCQWRKYGQKIAKGNPCPRAYYRCTVSPSCPVRKQVQRCMDDMSILITTYEGTHNHPLPISATAMASTTAAAASMLQSRSTTSTNSNNLLPGGLNSNFLTSPSTTSTSLFQSSNIRQLVPHQFYFPSSTSISTSTSHPTVTLDLTVPNPSSSSHMGPRYSSTCLSFSSSSSSSSVLPWNITNSYNNNGYLSNYGTLPHQNKPNPIIGSHSLMISNDGYYNKQPFHEASNNNLYQSYLNNVVNQSTSTSTTHQQSMTETIAAATKAITSNPKFQSALAAALTSFVGKGESEV